LHQVKHSLAHQVIEYQGIGRSEDAGTLARQQLGITGAGADQEDLSRSGGRFARVRHPMLAFRDSIRSE